MIVAMIQTGQLPVQTLGDGAEGFAQRFDGIRADGGPRPFLQAPLDEVLELPEIKFQVETLLESDARIVALRGAAQLNFQKLVDGFLIPTDNVFVRRALDPVPKRGV